MSQYVPRTPTLMKPVENGELKTRISEPCGQSSGLSGSHFGWNNVLVLTTAMLSARDTRQGACGTKELMSSLFKR
jgi:hypothetical protein